MYTSDTKQAQKTLQRTVLAYLAASIFCAVFGVIYEIFSHGVVSFFMVGAFLFPLLCGFLPFLLLSIAAKSRKRPAYVYPNYIAQSFYHSGVIALTLGSIVTGVLEIYGTTNVLIAAYWFAGAALMLAGILSHLTIFLFSFQRAQGDTRK